jgi:hypothetical protein
MIFAKVDVSIHSHPKFIAAGFEASGYWVHALAYLRYHESSDGFLASSLIAVPLSTHRNTAKRLCEKLVSVGLFGKVDDGYVLLGYAKKNETKAEIEERKEAVRERKAKARSRSGRSLDPPNGQGPPPLVPPDATAPVTRDIREAVTRDEIETVTRPGCEVGTRPSRVPSDSDSDSDSSSVSDSDSGLLRGGVQRGGPVAAVAQSGPTPARRPLPPSERGLSGPAWLAAFGDGITQQTGRPCSVGRMYVSTLERIVEHHAPQRDAPSACTWLRDQSAAFAAQWDGQHPPKGLTPDGLERWLNDGRVGPPQFGRKRTVQLPADQWKPDDWSDMGVLEVLTADGVVVPSRSAGPKGGSS